MKRISPRRRQEGFTLLEVLIAMSLMGVGILSIALAQLTAIKIASKSKHQSQAMYLAKEKMDEFAAMPGTNGLFLATSTTNDPDNPLSVVGASPNDTTTYDRSWEIVTNSPSAGLTTITVIVEWSNAEAANVRAIRLSMYKSQSL